MTSKEQVIDPVEPNSTNKLKGDNPNDDNSTQGRDLIEQAFYSQ